MIFKAADFLFFAGNDWKSKVIEYGQWPPFRWGPSHVGIIINYQKQPLLWEVTTLCDLPCEIQKKRVSGIQCHFPADRIASYPGRVFYCELQEREELSSSQSDFLTALAVSFVGESYDYEGALDSANPWMNRLCGFPDMGSLFCSAGVAYLAMRLGLMDRANPKLYSPEKLRRIVLANATHKPLVRLE